MWICPACKFPLLPVGAQWVCQNHHSFDRAKEGYVNLLLANQKGSREPGDNRQMIDARRQFLEQGFYASLGTTIARLVFELARGVSLNLYDAGCGEGYFLKLVAEDLRQRGMQVTASGSDISKYAIRKAAKKYPQLHFAVASNFNLPVADASQDFLLQIFAPVDPAEVSRVLNAGGYWIQVGPGPAHLKQLRQALQLESVEHTPDTTVPAGFVLQQIQSLEFDFVLAEVSSREQLLQMTPYYWTVSRQAVSPVLEATGELHADFFVRVLAKIPHPDLSAIDPA